MSTLLLTLLALLLMLHGYREYWRLRNLPQVHQSKFTGELMQVGATYVLRRSAKNGCPRSIICFPGFLEDMRYFQDLYQDNDAELILVNNANYHCPFINAKDTTSVKKLDWPKNPYQIGTIEYDGFYLGLVLSRLANGSEIYLHGHSRGGAVVLETGRQYADLTSSSQRPVSAILEAAVLPQARTAGNGSKPLTHRILCYFMPIFFGLSRNISIQRLLKLPMMRPTNSVKTDLMKSVFVNSRSYATCVVNVQSIVSWQRTIGFEVYDNFPSISIVMGARDTTLDGPSMLASAEQGQTQNHGLSIIRTKGTNHFISLEQPDTILAIYS